MPQLSLRTFRKQQMPNLFTWAALQMREKISLFSTWSVCQPHLPHLPLLLIKNPLFILILPFINNSRSILLHSVIEKQHKPMACQACECLISALPEKLKNLQEKCPFCPCTARHPLIFNVLDPREILQRKSTLGLGN
jgi:hypothetical protein